ncbi:MAG: acetyl-CoA carboxylase carboxyl transferase subunit alpha [Rhodopirellula sp.]|nr:acetyl-CoA carboxylase carboxyl transferase subunit alpha [Rhodopirellula sp.]HCA50560.1 acetyl-CoA carboxylase carboxyl transferase subunit alpha [Planctomycetaceae bacterium]|tara:strand:+ start:17899 stop:18873 length:975 start_codon:yes stop_codon:yes gene_type:complete
MSSAGPGLAFEQPIFELEQELETLESEESGNGQSAKVRDLKNRIADITRDVYANLSPWETVQVARHQNRPYTRDYLNLVFDEFVELHGDRKFGDDRAILTGFAKLDDQKVMVVGHQKGRTVKERTECYFGCAHPEGYRKAMQKMQLAAKFNLPVICFIDTPGAYPGIGAEERGQAWVIAENMYEMSRLETPIICIVIGEGGSGGALGIGVGDRIAMLEHSYYSVISPEGCAGILWKSHEHAPKAADALKFTSKHLPGLGVVDDIIQEPLGGAHRDHQQMAIQIKQYLLQHLKGLKQESVENLLAKRYNKFRVMGKFLDESEQNG